MLVDLDRDAAIAALEREPPAGAARAVRRRARCRARLRGRCRLHSAPMKIGIVGLGYVGLPLAVAFCEAGHEVVGVDTDARVVGGARERALARRGRAGRGAARASRDRFRPDHALRGPGEGRRHRRGGPHAAHAQPRAGPPAADRRRHGARRRAPGGPARRARVDDLPRHHARALRAAARGVRPRGRARLPRGLLARADRPGPHRLHAAHHAEGRGRAHRRVPPPRGGRSTRRSATRSWRSRPRRPPSSRSCSRTSSAR